VEDVGEKDQPDADPKDEDAGDPKADKETVFAINQEPEGYAGQKTGNGGQKERTIDFIKHRVMQVFALVISVIRSLFV
jgi:hypothetical protein